MRHETADSEHHLGQHREFGIRTTEVLDDLADLRNDEKHQAEECQDGDADQYHRIRHGTLDLFAHGSVFLLLEREALQDLIEDTGGLAGTDHIDVDAAEGIREFLQGITQRCAGFDVTDNALKDFLQSDALRMVVQ